MIKFHYIYRPATGEYLQDYVSDRYGLHLVWSYLPDHACEFTSYPFAKDLAEIISQADKIRTQVLPFKQICRNIMMVRSA
ncbi:hypothetical protein ACFO25_06675 [Paenactinomyces guangxiensis]|uniref:Uncharacterized protein n=1 Tax=Paenactinomyces guangxiensis TaxID=1490290 RepID=A0A7W2A776_9BACL|nr:hypothetical protein [Paenactinomyces guangxiensis]MBA4493265.1 hypothetical protein [Paenactinomyces guangxiensis]MBH8589884.1 hypothetical protein [Paenactinomyces guangxiensis]